jgi:hypothetical protein
MRPRSTDDARHPGDGSAAVRVLEALGGDTDRLATDGDRKIARLRGEKPGLIRRATSLLP